MLDSSWTHYYQPLSFHFTAMPGNHKTRRDCVCTSKVRETGGWTQVPETETDRKKSEHTTTTVYTYTIESVCSLSSVSFTYFPTSKEKVQKRNIKLPKWGNRHKKMNRKW